MFTAIDKALSAAFMAAVYLAKNIFDIDVGLSAEMFNGILMAVTPLLVYFIPNKPWTEVK